MEFNASEQIRAHNRTASIITTFELNSWTPKYESVELWLFVKAGEVVGDWWSIGSWKSNLLVWDSTRSSLMSCEVKEVEACMFFVRELDEFVN
jgi:hypothetical protein